MGILDDYYGVKPLDRSTYRAIGDAATKFVGGVPKAAAGLVGLGSFVPGVHYAADPLAEGLNNAGNWVEDQLLSDVQKRKDQELSRVLQGQEGFWDDAKAAGSYLWDNPSQAAMTAIGSIPSMIAGGIAGKGIRGGLAAFGAKPISAATAAAAGEGAVIAGSVGSEIAARNPEDFAARYYGIPAGLAGAAIGRAGAKLMGGSDIDTMIVNGMTREALEAGGPLNLLQSLPKRVGLGVVGEGLVEEAPQSAVERMMTNLGVEDPMMQGVGAEAVIGGAAGGVMGGAAGLRRPGGTYTMQERDQALQVLSDPTASYGARIQAAEYLQRIQDDGRPRDLLNMQQEAEEQFVEQSATELADQIRAERMPSMEPEFQWQQPGQTKEDVAAAFDEVVGTVGDKPVTAWDAYKAAHPEIFAKQEKAPKEKKLSKRQQEMNTLMAEAAQAGATEQDMQLLEGMVKDFKLPELRKTVAQIKAARAETPNVPPPDPVEAVQRRAEAVQPDTAEPQEVTARQVLEGLIAKIPGKIQQRDVGQYFGLLTGVETDTAVMAERRGVSRQAANDSLKRGLASLRKIAEKSGVSLEALQRQISEENDTGLTVSQQEILDATQTSTLDDGDLGTSLTVKDNTKKSFGETRRYIDPEQAYRETMLRTNGDPNQANLARARAQANNAELAQLDAAEGPLEEPIVGQTLTPTYEHSAEDVAKAKQLWEELQAENGWAAWEVLSQEDKDSYTQMTRDILVGVMPNYSRLDKHADYLSEKYDGDSRQPERRTESPDDGARGPDLQEVQAANGEPDSQQGGEPAETEEVVQGDDRQGARGEISAELIEAEWDKGVEALGLPQWGRLSYSQQDYMLGSGTWQEFDEAAAEIAEDLTTGRIPADEAGFTTGQPLESQVSGRTKNPSTEKDVLAALYELAGVDATAKNAVPWNKQRLAVYGTLSEVPENLRHLFTDNNTQGVAWEGIRAVILAERVEKGTERGVLLHEVGAHVGLTELIGEKNVIEVANQIERMGKGGSRIEQEAVAAAQARIPQDTPQGDRVQELIGYTAEELDKRGIRPQGQGMGSQLLRKIMALVRTALNKLGLFQVSTEAFTGQDLMDLLQGSMANVMQGQRQFTTPRLNSVLRSDGTAFDRLTEQMAQWKSVVSEYLSGALDRTKTHTLLDSTPASMQAMGLPNLQVRVGVHALDYANIRLTQAQLEDLPRQLAQPKAVYIHEGKEGPSINFVTEYGNASGLVVAAMRPNQYLGDGATGHFVVTLINIPANRIVDEMREGNGVFTSSPDALPGLRAALDIAKRKNGRQASELRTLLARRYNLPSLTKRLLYPSDLVKMISEGRALYSKTAANVVESFKTGSGDRWAKLKPYLLSLQQMNDQYGTKIKSMPAYTRTVGAMEQLQQQITMEAHPIIVKWQSLDAGVRDRLHKLMKEATLSGAHPDVAFDDPLNAHLSDKAKATHDKLRAQYTALPMEAKDIYQQSKGQLQKLWKQRGDFYTALVNHSYAKLIENQPEQKAKLEKKRDKLIAEHQAKLKELKGPYFPLLRFGDYIVVGKSKAYLDLETSLDGLEGQEYKDAAAKLAGMKKDAKHYSVWATESLNLANQKMRELQGQGLQVKQPQLAEEHSSALSPVSAYSMQRINAVLNNQLDAGTANKVERLLTELYLTSLPEHSALQRQIKRIGVEGANDNMLRTFARAIQADSFHLSRMKYGTELSSLLFQMEKEAKDAGTEAQHAMRVIKKSLDLDMEYKPHPVLGLIQKFTSFMMLGVSPAYLFTNASQPWMIALPQIAGVHGFNNTLKAMSAAWGDAKNAIVASKKKGAFADIDFNAIKDANERQMLQFIRDNGQVDITINFDTGIAAEDSDPRIARAERVAAWANHHIEVSNRITTALTAYRLAKQSGQSHDKATEYAYKQVVDTQLDYSNANAAYFMKGQHFSGLNRLIMQFKKYQQGMLYLLAHNAQQAFKGDRQAMASLGYLMAMQVSFAGLAGVPLMFPLLMLVPGGGDDEGDNETRFRNMLTDAFGKDVADAMYKGLPTMLGMDLSKRLGLGELLDPTPFYDIKDIKREKTGKDAVGNLALSLAGPAAGMTSNYFDAGFLGFRDGEWGKAFEKALPKALSDPLKATRYAETGITTRKGNVALEADKLSTWDLWQRGLGFTSAKESNYYEAVQAKEDTKAALEARRSRLITNWANYKLRGDTEAVAEMEHAVKNWNAKHPEKGVRIDRSTLLKSVQQRRKDAAQRNEAGVLLKKNEQHLRDVTRFAAAP